MRKPILFLLAGLVGVLLSLASAEARIYSVADWGAKGTGQVLDTTAIQATIDAAAKTGGGTVWFPAGTYLSGTIYLRNGITLHLDSGAVLLGSTRLEDYPVNRPKIRSYTDNYVERSLIAGEDLQNITITGRGMIDGQGGAFKWKDYLNRPYVIRLVNCFNVMVENITMQNSAMWMQHYLACSDLTIRGIRVTNFTTYNNDGLDIDSCQNVRISDCQIFSDDDALCLKSTTLLPCENVTITNCLLGSHCNALKMGTESNGGFKNIAISNCTIQSLRNQPALSGEQRGLSGISLEIVDGGVMDRVAISNVTMEGVIAPLFIRLGNRARPFKPDSPVPGIGVLRNVLIENIVATDASLIGCSITGQPERAIEDVTLRNIHITFEGGGTAADAARAVERKPAAYPESTMFGTLPAYGFFSRHVNGLTFDRVHLSYGKTDSRPAAIFDQVQDLTINGFKAKPGSGNTPVMVLNQTAQMRVTNSVALPGTGTFAYVRASNQELFLGGNDLREAKTDVMYVGR